MADVSELTTKELEKEFQSYIVDFLRLNGWKVHHSLTVETKRGFRTPLSGSPGLPDIIATQGGRVAFLELKSDSGRLSGDQVAWLNALAGVEQQAKFWNGKFEEPPHVTRGEPWDVLVGVLRPMWRGWFEARFLMLQGLAI